MKSSTAIALATIGGLAATGVAAPIHVVLSIIDECVTQSELSCASGVLVLCSAPVCTFATAYMH